MAPPTATAAGKAAPDGDLLTEREVQSLLAACSERAPTGVRNRALVALLYASGLRVAEALALAPGELELATGEVRVGPPRRRRAHVFPAAWPYLEAWTLVRPHLGLPARAPLFCTLAGEALESSYVRTALARLGRRAGVRKRVHAHGLRHSFAVRVYGAGATLAALTEQLGLADDDGTRRALTSRGVEPGPRPRVVEDLRQVPFGLAPEPGRLRAELVLRQRGPAAAPVEPPTDDGRVVVRRVRFGNL